MKKWLFRIIVLLIVISGSLLAVVFFNINPIVKALTPEITKIISSELKQDVAIDKIKLQLFPGPALNVTGLKLLSNATEQSENFIKELSLETDWRSLIKRRLEIKSILIRDPLITIHKIQDGSLKLGSLPISELSSSTNKDSTSTSSSSSRKGAAANDAGEKVLTFQVKEAKIRGGAIQLYDDTVVPRAEVVISNLECNLDNLSLDSPVSLELVAELFSENGQNIKLSGDFNLAQTYQGIPKADLEITADPIGLAKLTPLTEAYKISTKNFNLNQKVKLRAKVINNNDEALLVEGIEIQANAIDVKAQAQYNKKQGVKINVLQANIPLAKLSEVTPQAVVFQLDGTILSQALIILPTENIDKTRWLQYINGSVELKNISAAIPLAQEANAPTIPVKQVIGLINLKDEQVTLKPLTAELLGGKLSSDLLLQQNQTLVFSLTGRSFDLKQLSSISSGSKTMQLSGSVDKLSVKGSSDIKQFSSSVVADAQIESSKGQVAGLNVLKEVIAKLQEIPGVESAITKNIPSEYHSLLLGNSTQFDKAQVAATLNGSRFQLHQLELQHPLYTIEGKGAGDMKGSLEVTAKLKFSSSFTQSLLTKQKKLKYLLDEHGNLTVPMVISREEDSWAVVPNLSELSKQAAKGGAIEAATKALDKVSPGLGDTIGSFFK